VKEVGPLHRVIRFDAFDVDLRNDEVRKHGFRIRLQDQPFHVLQILLEHAGELVTREELQRQIWPADTFVDFEKGLNNAIKRLRDALGDSVEQSRFIETLSKRGYRFMGAVEELGNGARMPAGPTAAVTVDSIAVLPFTSMSADPEDEFFRTGSRKISSMRWRRSSSSTWWRVVLPFHLRENTSTRASSGNN
jgi:DNA-binding winged helix-turn-helix (wHTH) protein